MSYFACCWITMHAWSKSIPNRIPSFTPLQVTKREWKMTNQHRWWETVYDKNRGTCATRVACSMAKWQLLWTPKLKSRLSGWLSRCISMASHWPALLGAHLDCSPTTELFSPAFDSWQVDSPNPVDPAHVQWNSRIVRHLYGRKRTLVTFIPFLYKNTRAGYRLALAS